MLRYVLYACILCFFTYLGYFFSERYRKRGKFFHRFSEFHAAYLSEIKYLKRPLGELLNGLPPSDFSDFMRMQMQQKQQPVGYLKPDEKEFLREYLSLLGRTDAISQTEYFSSVTAKLKSFETRAVEEGKKYTDLYIKLGFLLGLTVIIFLA